MTKLEIEYDNKYLAEEQLQKMNLNYDLIEVEGKRLNSDQHQMNMIPTETLIKVGKFVLNKVVIPIFNSVVTNTFINFWKNKTKKVDSSGNVESVEGALSINGNIKFIIKKDAKMTDIQWLNIYTIIEHFSREDNYIFIWNRNGELEIYTYLEYAQRQHDEKN